MDFDSQRKLDAILRILAESGRPQGSTSIAGELALSGIDLRQRMVRYYLTQADRMGLTQNRGRSGRSITPAGIERLRRVIAVEKIGFISARVDELSYRMTFDIGRREGTVVLNVSRMPAASLPSAAGIIGETLAAGLGMGGLVTLRREGEEIAGYRVGRGEVAVGTVCSVTLNGVFRAAGIPISSRFGGLLEIREGKAVHFTHIIHYDGTTIDPVEIFLKGRMTRVRQAVTSGNGTIGASFREIPVAALPAATALIGRLTAIGLLGGFHVIGRPGQPLLDIPVPQGRVGLIVPAGLNAIAAVEESGIETHNVAMAALHEHGDLVPAVCLGGGTRERPHRSRSAPRR
jgi:repressor of nif and glnA expression